MGQTKHSSRSSGNGKSHKEPTSNGYYRQHQGGKHGEASAPLSFLFVVNEVRAIQQTLDSWGSKCPPEDPQGYSEQVPSRVMRYSDGAVEVVDGYRWSRVSSDGGGGIFWHDQNGVWYQAGEYATATVLSCHPLIPVAMVNTDATALNTIHRGSDRPYQASADEQFVWQPLLFFHPEHLRGVSQVMFQSEMKPEYLGGSPVKYVAGKGQLMKSLTPETYRYPGDHPPESKGMGGNLAALLGLMALTSAPDGEGRNRADSVIPRKWRGNRWHGEHSPRGCESAFMSVYLH